MHPSLRHSEFRVKAHPFLELVSDSQARIRELLCDQIKGLNGVIQEKIEVVRCFDASR